MSTLNVQIKRAYETPSARDGARVLVDVVGRSYINFHTTQYTGGEIRGFLVQVLEPATLTLVGLGCLGIAGIRRRTV